MNETPQQYRERIWNQLGSSDPIAVLKQTSETLKRLFGKSEKSKWDLKPDDHHWSAAQVLAHLAEGEIVFAYRLRMIVRDSGTAIQGFDQDVWIQNSKYLIVNPELAIELFTSVRSLNVVYLESLPADVMEHFGIHSERGKETVRDVMRMYAGHDLNHLKQIERQLRSRPSA